MIDDSGLILTVGYLIIEAGSILAMAPDGRVHPATVVGFDHASGFGLLRASPGIIKRPIQMADSSTVKPLQTVRIAAHAAAVRALFAVHSLSVLTLLLFEPGTLRPTNTMPR